MKTGSLAAFNFDKEDALNQGWSTSKRAEKITFTAGKDGRALRLTGADSGETNVKVVFAETGLNKTNAPLEGKNSRVVTEFDIRLNNITGPNVDLQFGKDVPDEGQTSSNTPGINIIFGKGKNADETEYDAYYYKTGGSNAGYIPYQQNEWVHFKITHMVTSTEGRCA